MNVHSAIRRFLITSDLHQYPGKWARLAEVCAFEEPDFVVVAGDLFEIGHCGSVEASERDFVVNKLPGLLKEIRKKAPACEILLQMGNDDIHTLEPELRSLEAAGLCHCLNDEVRKVKGQWFAGMNRVRDYPFGYKHWVARDGNQVECPVQFRIRSSEELERHRQWLLSTPSIRERLETLAAKLPEGAIPHSVWLIHQPPKGVGMAQLESGEDVGSDDVLEFLETRQPMISCHGHIHESPGTPGGMWAMALTDTLVLQPGQMGERLHYVTCHAGVEGGVFDITHSIFGRSPLDLGAPLPGPD